MSQPCPPPPAQPAPAEERGAAAGAAPPRIAALDAARGAALLAMAVYHLGWDLSALQLIAVDVARLGPWQIAARLIAGTFLALAGVGLVLAHGREVRWRAFLRRLALVGGAALLVTLTTLVVVPQGFIYFGILHCIAASSVLALPFLRRPAWVSAAAAVLALAAGNLVSVPALSAPWLLPLGLGTSVPASNDYVPLLPWFGCMLAGVAAARLGRGVLLRSSGWRPRGRLGRTLALAGRHSLAVYLLHQPVLLAVLVPVSWALGPGPGAAAAGFKGSFTRSCEAAGVAPEACRAVLACTLARVEGTEPWARLHLGHSEDERFVRDAARACYAERFAAP